MHRYQNYHKHLLNREWVGGRVPFCCNRKLHNSRGSRKNELRPNKGTGWGRGGREAHSREKTQKMIHLYWEIVVVYLNWKFVKVIKLISGRFSIFSYLLWAPWSYLFQDDLKGLLLPID